MKIIHICLWCLLCVALTGCKDSKTQDTTQTIKPENETWLFNKQYIKTINESSWEKVSVHALNNYEDFKINFSYISTGKPQTCGLYAKGIFATQTNQTQKDANILKKFLLRPNLIPDTTIWVIYNKKDSGTNELRLEISNMVSFIKACGDAHQYVVGEYEIMQ